MRRFPRVGCLLVLGALSCGIGDAQQRLRTAVDERREELGRCYADVLSRDRNAAGTVQLSVHVADNTGEVDDVRLDRSDVQDPAFAECISTALKTIRLFPKPPTAALQVHYTLELTPDS